MDGAIDNFFFKSYLFYMFLNVVSVENFPYVVYSRFIQTQKVLLGVVMQINFINNKAVMTVTRREEYILTICENIILGQIIESRLDSLNHLELHFHL